MFIGFEFVVVSDEDLSVTSCVRVAGSGGARQRAAVFRAAVPQHGDDRAHRQA